LPGDERARLFSEIGELIDGKYNGRIVKQYVAVLDLRKKRHV